VIGFVSVHVSVPVCWGSTATVIRVSNLRARRAGRATVEHHRPVPTHCRSSSCSANDVRVDGIEGVHRRTLELVEPREQLLLLG
jgi:hypothetical protein